MDAFPLQAPQFSGTTRKVPVLNAFEWIRQGWAIFLVAPSLWLTLGVGLLFLWGFFEFLFVFTLAVMPASVLRQILSGFFLFAPAVLLPVVSIGGLQVCRKITAGETPAFSDLAWGFVARGKVLLTVGALFLAGWLALFAFYAMVKGPLALFLPTVAGFAFLMAIWFSPTLVAFHDMNPLDAMRASFLACANNLGTFLAFGFVMMLLHFAALLPLGLGLPVLLPVVIGALHASYRDVYPES